MESTNFCVHLRDYQQSQLGSHEKLAPSTGTGRGIYASSIKKTAQTQRIQMQLYKIFSSLFFVATESTNCLVHLRDYRQSPFGTFAALKRACNSNKALKKFLMNNSNVFIIRLCRSRFLEFGKVLVV